MIRKAEHVQNHLGMLMETGGFVPNVQEYSENILGTLASSTLGVLCHTSCPTWNFPMKVAAA